MSKPPPPNDECYYAEDSNAVNEQTGGFQQSVKAQIRIIGAKVKGTKVGTMVTTIVRFIMSQKVTTTTTKTLTEVTKVTEMIGMGLMSLPKILKLLLQMVEIVWSELRICCTK